MSRPDTNSGRCRRAAPLPRRAVAWIACPTSCCPVRPAASPRSSRRTAIKLEEHDSVRDLLLDELDYARRIPMFEGRRPLYGSFSMPPGHEHHRTPAGSPTSCRWRACHARWPARSPTAARRSSSTATRQRPCWCASTGRCSTRPSSSSCRRSRGARIVQRTPVFGQVRLFTERRVVSWDGQAWTDRPTAAALLAALRQCAPDLDPAVAHGMLDLAVHWLSPARVGATIVVHEEGFEWASMDVATKFHAPRLSIKNRQHFPALFASLQQHDLATLVTADGQRRVPRRRSALERRGRAQRRQRPGHAPPLRPALQLRPPVDDDRRGQRQRSGHDLPQRSGDRPVGPD